MTMSVELLAIGCLFGWSVGSGIYALREMRRMKAEIPKLKEEVKAEVYEVGNTFIDGITEMFTDPTVKKAFGIIGSQGGEAKAQKGLVDEMATDMLDSPQFAAIKMGAQGLLGFDIDGYIEKHGAVKSLAAANQLASALGIDIMNIDLSSLAKGLPTGGASGGIYGQG